MPSALDVGRLEFISSIRYLNRIEMFVLNTLVIDLYNYRIILSNYECNGHWIACPHSEDL